MLRNCCGMAWRGSPPRCTPRLDWPAGPGGCTGSTGAGWRPAPRCGAAAAIAVGVSFAATDGSAGSGVAQARTVAYVTKRVENALAGENLVFVGRSSGKLWGNTVTWAYRSRNRFEEYWPAADARDRVVNGQRLWDFPPQDRGLPYLAQGTALVGGKLVGAHV